jgi:hypothetical protein
MDLVVLTEKLVITDDDMRGVDETVLNSFFVDE